MSNSPHYIHCGQLWQPEGFVTDQTLVLKEGRIVAVQPTETISAAAADALDATANIVIPGLIDVQVNGGLGWSFQAEHESHFDEIIAFHAAAGTTTLLPTLVTAPAETLRQSLRTLSNYLGQSQRAYLPGIHLEGPFLSPEKSGAHDPAALCHPDLIFAQQFAESAQDTIKILTIAPELPNAAAVIKYFAEQGVIVSAGHSAASYAQLRQAMATGLGMITHAGNASDWPHRAMGDLGFLTSEPGMVGTLMAEPELVGSIIMDGFHFHPALLKPLVQLKGPDRIILTSDAAPVAGCAPGNYDSGGLQVSIHPEGFATSGRGGGWLAGSIITQLTAMQRAVTLAGLDLHQAVWMASLGPARLLGLADRKGHLQVGADADVVILNEDLALQGVVVAGKI